MVNPQTDVVTGVGVEIGVIVGVEKGVGPIGKGERQAKGNRPKRTKPARARYFFIDNCSA